MTAAQESPSVVVALCTYNGAAYLREQLDSIAGQTRLPSRLLVLDDCSKDNTVGILQHFASSAPFPVEIVRNETNLGYVKNFEKALGFCHEDVVVLSDQDDVWVPDKLAKIERYLFDHPEIDAVFTDAELVDSERRAYGYSLWESIEFNTREQRWVESGDAFRVLLRRNVVTGATMAFRSRVKARVLPIPREWVHDEWISIIIAATGRLGFLPEKLIQYRQHGANQIGARRLSSVEKFKKLFTKRTGFHQNLYVRAKLLRSHLSGLTCAPVSTDVIHDLDCKLDHLSIRSYLPQARLLRLMPIIQEFVRGRYFRYSSGWKSVVRDLFEPF